MKVKLPTQAKRAKLSSGLTGIAGEYFVGAELSRRGYIASLTLRNTRGIDILGSNSDVTKSAGIQVKTSRGCRKTWILSENIQRDVATSLFFVFVRLHDLDVPQYHVVPIADVIKYIRDDHQLWMSTPGRKGQTHKDNPIRSFSDPDDAYLNKWEFLGLD